MSEFYNILAEILNRQQMSISRIARELKNSGYDQHRLILTGYLRALTDMGYLEEVEIPPSKVYVVKNEMNRDIYAVLKKHLSGMEHPEKQEVAVFILTSLFGRPCFRHELELLGIEAQKTKTVKESKEPRLKEHRAAVTRIKIPNDDPAYEITGEDSSVHTRGAQVMINILDDLIDLDGLKARFQQTKLA
ncbi:Uncharacterised protein [uncultured archaeon]|nr:Uncharacterised protein [uncultured archaeon]